jgi:hypothetical protein
MKEIVFFCQAPADIVHILKEYDNLRTEYVDNLQVKIICVNSKALFDYFNYLNLENIDIIYLDYNYISIKKLWEIWNWRIKSIKSIKDLGILSGNKSFYFCSIYDDPITTFFMNFLYMHNKKIIYLNHYDNIQNIVPLRGKNIKQKIYEKLYYLCTGIKYQYWNMSNRWEVLRFPIENIDCQIKHPVIDDVICKKYAYQVHLNERNQAILFFSQPNREKKCLDDEEYNNIHVQVALILKDQGYKIYTKGHPRIGVCNSLKNLADEEIPQFIPSELLDINMFKFCIGFTTIALASSAKLGIPTYSFLPLAPNHNSYYDGLIKFSIISGDNKIKFIHSLDELSEISLI